MREYETIGQARARLKASRTDPLSVRTIAGYKAKTRRLIKLASGMEGDGISNLIACAKDTKSAATWFSRRAALMFYFRTGIENKLAEQDKLQRELKAAQVSADAQEWNSWKKMVGQIEMYADWHARLQGEPGPAIEERKQRHSKRKDMRGLPDDWRERLIARLPKYRHAALVGAVTGCRPDELTKGVKLSIVDGKLIADIAGSKVTAASGQPWRRLSWPVDSESPLVRMLVAEVESGVSVVKIADAKAYSGAVRAAGAREWPKRTKSVSPYCFRHAAASDMKAAGVEDLEISQALGHCVDKAKSYYGQWKQGRGRGGVSPIKIEAARAVRISKPKISGPAPSAPGDGPRP